MAIKLKIVDSGDPLKLKRQRLIGDIIKAKRREEVEPLQKELDRINRLIRGKK